MNLLFFAGISLWSHASARSSASAVQTGSISTPTGTIEITKEEQCACRELLGSFARNVILPGQANYTEQTTDYYWDVRADLSPACVFVPETADAVASAIEIFSSCNAQFAVRGGGHMNYPGSNNIDGGVLVALGNLNSFTVNEDSIDVGPGLTWYDVYTALEPHGRVAIGGRMKTIGVPGLTLIGGFHYFNNKYGYAMDNVISYDVVLGNGTQVTAAKDSHPDLFWALKGGANNYGVVTKFTLKTYNVPKVTSTIQIFNESAFPQFFDAMCKSAVVDEEDPTAAGMIATISYNVTTKVASASLLGVQEGVSMPPSKFADFFSIPATMRMNNVTTMGKWSSKLDSPKQMFRVMFSHKTMKPDSDTILSIYKAWKAAVEQISDVEGLYPTFVLNEITPSSLRVANTNGIGNVWGLQAEPLMIWQFSTGWALAQDDRRVEAWSQQLTEHLHAINQEKGIASEFVYMGDAGDWQDPFAGFPAENVNRMREIRAAYDPNKVFSRLNWGGFKLGM
ncbi:hypothetical protein N7474_003784 [Penicillium riverlandense]|uniref:uncharacterized protein n=1 Tax=Penicillium riverlandense TaxID=1903569 RepID=UPI00254662F9|nr:uncharacterized protein N7474_003784 [Penicillium riverlandense]KAJ5818193.1 hypothetical protein N7474_003784 [Penicillium riverlandense]